MAGNTEFDVKSITDAYDNVRNDSSENTWAVFRYENKRLFTDSVGVSFDDFVSKFADDERAFGFLRVTVGDELSKRSKFVLITWVGPSVGALKKAKVQYDRAKLKEIVQSFAYERHVEHQNDFNYQEILEEVRKVGGANYGTGGGTAASPGTFTKPQWKEEPAAAPSTPSPVRETARQVTEPPAPMVSEPVEDEPPVTEDAAPVDEEPTPAAEEPAPAAQEDDGQNDDFGDDE